MRGYRFFLWIAGLLLLLSLVVYATLTNNQPLIWFAMVMAFFHGGLL